MLVQTAVSPTAAILPLTIPEGSLTRCDRMLVSSRYFGEFMSKYQIIIYRWVFDLGKIFP